MGISTARVIVNEVCRALWAVLQGRCCPQPTKEIWAESAKGFELTANFPNCVGAVDGKHIRLMCPVEVDLCNFNYKEYHSIVLMAVADSSYKLTFVNI